MVIGLKAHTGGARRAKSMHYLTGILIPIDFIRWHYHEDSYENAEVGLRIAFVIYANADGYHRRAAVMAVRRSIAKEPLSWLSPTSDTWRIDLDKLKAAEERLKPLNWLSGIVDMNPEFEQEHETTFGGTTHSVSLAFYLTPDSLRDMRPVMKYPPEISDSILEFQKDYPDPMKAVFVMMRFDKSKRHHEIFDSISAVLDKYGVKALRADTKPYHDNLLSNILTYMWGCGSGVAVFERLKTNNFNPNVSFELGYMMALPKAVCLLKDDTLDNLHSDLGGLIYHAFNMDDIPTTIPAVLTKWLEDRGIIHVPPQK